MILQERHLRVPFFIYNNHMIKIILLFLLLPLTAFSRDCVKEFQNYKAGITLTYSINDLMERYGSKNLNVCDDPAKDGQWKDTQRRIYESLIKSEAKDWCKEVDQQIKTETGCHLPESYLLKLKARDFRRVKFSDACREKLPLLHKLYKICVSNAGPKAGNESE